ncbi:hypothetical protein CANARDRAFT_29005 [[Candida] arabinofermentans NRRL YB-2248]|uniref:Uncharacterized protein n=1 Tax=[Candida] arabinofermentans NRRL YB-2248 TaxID=983967 RepID=A0A1E4SY82_9ASCO|nr:hypothetical protein CANARDRAFT_29005 [[Candida] arabinofermentans NRRL YB-2248]
MVNFRKLIQFIGPGLLISCAYIDPGNYSTSMSAGGQFGYIHLFIIFLSNLFAVILQCLCIKLGTVTGLDLAENCRKHLPRWLNLTVYVLAETCIIFTDLAEVVGSAIALYIIFGIPLNIGVFITVLDVLVILLAYNPDGSLKQIRKFEIFVSAFVVLTFISFTILLSKVTIPDKTKVFEGFLPTKEVFGSKQSIYLALGIVGATVMPHSLYLGSNLVKPRLKEFDIQNENYTPTESDPNETNEVFEWNHLYKPSFDAINYCLHYSYLELILSLCTIAVFINSAILIVAGSTLAGKPDAEDADLITIYDLLCDYISKGAGFVFALAMLFSSIAAGIICTMSGALVAEGGLHWKMNPLVRRLITRTLAIIPCMFMSLLMGREGIASILNLSQVILSLMLPFLAAPLLYFTSDKKIMRVEVNNTSTTSSSDIDGISQSITERERVSETSALLQRRKSADHSGIIEVKDFSNSLLMNVLGVSTWLCISSMNIYLIVQFIRGEDVHF